LTVAEHSLNNMVCPDSMPPLPEGFYDKHGKETALSGNQSDFCTKDECLRLMEEQRTATLDKLSDGELEQPALEKISSSRPRSVRSLAASQRTG
jgi:hypothetical protein